jgi:hypothetical protein
LYGKYARGSRRFESTGCVKAPQGSESSNLVVVRPDGQKRWYELNAQPLMKVDEFLEPYRQFLSEKLDNLERHLNNMDQ